VPERAVVCFQEQHHSFSVQSKGLFARTRTSRPLAADTIDDIMGSQSTYLNRIWVPQTPKPIQNHLNHAPV
jgi:hypothetical protein